MNTPYIKENLFDFLFKVGQISTQYKTCWNDTERAIVDGITWTEQFNGFTDYLLYLIPNMLAQAIILNRYIERIERFE